MKDIAIEDFGTKLMVNSKSINNIPYNYLSYAQNARIYDGGIGPARGKEQLLSSTIGTNNKGGFVLNNKLYQITNSKIYEIDKTDGTQTEIADLGYDTRTDIVSITFSKGAFTSLGSYNSSYDISDGSKEISEIRFDVEDQTLELRGTGTYDTIALGEDNSSYAYPAVNIIKATTTRAQSAGTGKESTDTLGYIIEDGEYMTLSFGAQTGDVYYEVGYLEASFVAIIASDGKDIQVFDGTNLTVPTTQPGSNSGIIEYANGYTFLASNSVLYISVPTTIDNPEYSYDFTGTDAQSIVFDSIITGLQSTMSGLYIFTEDKVEYLGANSLQNISGSATFITTTLGKGGKPANNQLITASGDKIFYMTENKEIRTINYISGTSDPTIGNLSSVPVVSITEFFNDIGDEQITGFAFENKNDNTIQFHIRSINAGFNDKCLIYDMVNETWGVDKGKYYNFVISIGKQYYGFSDINSSIYLDDIGNSMAGSSIPFKISTQQMNQRTLYQKLYGGFFIAGALLGLTDLSIKVLIDGDTIFEDTICGESGNIFGLGEIGGEATGLEPTGGDLNYIGELAAIEKLADEGRIFQYGTKISIDISSLSDVQDFIIDTLGVRAEVSSNIDISDKF